MMMRAMWAAAFTALTTISAHAAVVDIDVVDGVGDGDGNGSDVTFAGDVAGVEGAIGPNDMAPVLVYLSELEGTAGTISIQVSNDIAIADLAADTVALISTGGVVWDAGNNIIFADSADTLSVAAGASVELTASGQIAGLPSIDLGASATGDIFLTADSLMLTGVGATLSTGTGDITLNVNALAAELHSAHILILNTSGTTTLPEIYPQSCASPASPFGGATGCYIQSVQTDAGGTTVLTGDIITRWIQDYDDTVYLEPAGLGDSTIELQAVWNYGIALNDGIEGPGGLIVHTGAGKELRGAIGANTALASLVCTTGGYTNVRSPSITLTGGLSMEIVNFYEDIVITSENAGNISFANRFCIDSGSNSAPRSVEINTAGVTSMACAGGFRPDALRELVTDAPGSTLFTPNVAINNRDRVFISDFIALNDAVKLGGTMDLVILEPGNSTIGVTTEAASFAGTVDSYTATHRGLTVTMSRETHFRGVVGGIEPLASLTVNGGGTTYVYADVTADGAIVFADDVVLVDCPAVSSLSGAVSYLGTVTADFENCQSCAPTGGCAECSGGFFLQSGACVPCTVCEEGTYESAACSVTANSTCTSCDASCTACDGGSVTDCTACGASEYTTAGACYACGSCFVGNYESVACSAGADVTCEPCSSGCAECLLVGACDVCETGLFLESGSCTTCGNCQDGTYEAAACTATADTTCAACEQSCSTCDGAGATDCTACAGGAYLDTGSCIACSVCEPGTYAASACSDAADTSCVACDQSCTTCDGAGATGCTACAVDTYLAAGACTACSACQLGTYSVAACTSTADSACDACDVSCAACDGATATDCTECAIGTSLSAGSCAPDPDPSIDDSPSSGVASAGCDCNATSAATLPMLMIAVLGTARRRKRRRP